MKTGSGQDPPRYGLGSLYSYGAEVANRSKDDAVGVTITVTVYARGLGSFMTQDFSVPVIPAGQHFVVGNGGGGLGTVPITRVTASVHVRSMQPHRYQLPLALNVRIDRKNSAVDADIFNPYSSSINLWNASAYTVVLDNKGRIVGGGNDAPLTDGVTGPQSLKPAARLRVGVPVTAPMSRVVRAEFSVTP